MSDKRRGLGRGLGALIPQTAAGDRPVDVFFRDAETPGATSTGTPGGQRPGGHAERTDRRDRPEWRAEHLATATALGLGRRPLDAEPVTGTAGTGTGGDEDTDALAAVPGASYAELPVRSIQPNARQPRTVFDDDDMAELVHSVRELGVLQPIVVRPLMGESSEEHAEAEYELVMGERRWRASQEAGLETVPAIIRRTDDDEMLRHALLENLHRSQLNPLEEAAAYQQLLEDFGCTHDELASRLGRSRPQISNTVRLLRLPPLVQRRVAAGVLSAGHARALLGLEDGAAMERLAQRIVAEGLSVRSVEEIVALGGDGSADKPARPGRAARTPPELEEVASSLADRFETRVQVAMGKRKGKLTVEFASMDDLQRILTLMGRE
ncbi:ParB/RepB/Spo0J family partition protein [Arsenicicoccus dermatophilus]|uniref:ParB/RepB/Spo0J family partition protein n=1 Tax=Arsenicicoccus dermatophilus TaxID=1076331 RepID=UPI0038917C4B